MRPIILWFRRDLRLADHPALTAAAASGLPLVALYVLDEESKGVRPSGGAARWWLERSLKSLAESLEQKGVRLILRKGRSADILAETIESTSAAAVHFTRDYAPWSEGIERDVRAAAEVHGAECHRHRGLLLHEPESIRTGSGEPYKVFTPFSRACFEHEPDRVPRPVPRSLAPFKGKLASDRLSDWKLYPGKPDWAAEFPKRWTPGEQGAHAALKRFVEATIGGYKDRRDLPGERGTSRLSPHLHLGEISPLQCWHAARSAMAKANGRHDEGGETFLKELLWREFSYHLLHQFPALPEKPFRAEFRDFPWARDKTLRDAWRRGLTGYPIVDAGMRELWTTGWMHNRVRLIVGSFHVKHLLQPWQEGEAWFWDTLLDADIANNPANWQWVAGCGADAAPYFRIFNPVLQGEKFDPEGTYVRRWVPEIAKLPNSHIHKPWRAPDDMLKAANVLIGKDYPAPIVDLGKGRERALKALAAIKKG